MTVVWSFPTRVVFGTGTVMQTGLEAKSLGCRRALIVTDQGIVDAGVASVVKEALTKAGIEAEIFSAISSNPREEEVLQATEAWRQSQADVVIAVGGGSAVDVAKLVRLAASHALPLAQYDDEGGGGERITENVPPMIAVPTTAGTGSEVGRRSVVTIAETGRKTVIFSPRLMPDVAILDPELTTSMPPKVTAATGFDALTHCIESYCAKGDHPMADAVALEGIGLIGKSLERAVNDGKDMDARGNMMKAAMMGAVATQKGLGACHALAHPLSSELDMHHGLANALCLPAVLDFNRTAVPERIARVSRTLGVRGDDAETLCFECSGAVRALRRKVGLPEGLAAAGVAEEQLTHLAALAIQDPGHRLNPRACVEEDMLALYKASM